MTYDAQCRSRHAINSAAAMAARVDHSWLSNAVDCGFARAYQRFGVCSEAWENTHVLHRYGISRYGYLIPDLQPPTYP